MQGCGALLCRGKVVREHGLSKVLRGEGNPMLQTIWKLTFLTGVVGIGMLVVWQARNGMQFSRSDNDKSAVVEQHSGKPESAKGAGASPKSSGASGIKPGVTPAAEKTGRSHVASAGKNSHAKKNSVIESDSFPGSLDSLDDAPPAKGSGRKTRPAADNPFDGNVELAGATAPPKTLHAHEREAIIPASAEDDPFAEKGATDAKPASDKKPAGETKLPAKKSEAPPLGEDPLGEDKDIFGTPDLKTKPQPKPEVPPAKPAERSASVPALGEKPDDVKKKPPGRSDEGLKTGNPIKRSTPPAVEADPLSAFDPAPATGSDKPAKSREVELPEAGPPETSPAAGPRGNARLGGPGSGAKPAVIKPPKTDLGDGFPDSTPPRREAESFDPFNEPGKKPVKSVEVAPRSRATAPVTDEFPTSVPPTRTPTSVPPVESALPSSVGPAPVTLPATVPDTGSSASSLPPATPVMPATPVLPRNATPVSPGAPATTPEVTSEPTPAPVRNPTVRRSPRGVQKPQVTIDKVAPQTAVLGKPLIYHIFVRNVGAVAAHQVTVEDRIPVGVHLEGTRPQAELSEGKLIWRLGTLDKNTEKKISIKVTPENEGEVGSVATVNFAAEVGAATTVTAPQLEFHMSGPEQATLGSQVTYTFQVTNVGRGQAYNVKIRNVIPSALRHAAGDDLEMEDAIQLAAGKSYETTITVAAAQLGKTVNRAVVTADGGISVQAESPLEIVTPGLSVNREGPKRLLLNRQGTYVNTVSNSSEQVLRNVTVTETVPGGFSFVSATENGRFDATKKSVTWTLDRLNPKQSQVLQVTLSSVGRGSLVSVVRATDGSGASGEAVGTTHVAGVPSLSIDVAEMPTYLEVGQRSSIKVRVRNRGSDVAENVHLKMVLPSGTELVVLNGGKYQRDGDEIVFDTIPRIQPRHELVLDLTLKAVEPQETRLQVAVQGEGMAQPLHRDEALSIVPAK